MPPDFDGNVRTIVHCNLVQCASPTLTSTLLGKGFHSVMPTPPTDPRPRPLLGETALRDFIGAGAVTRLQAVGRTCGVDLGVYMGPTDATLGNARGAFP